MQPETIQVLLDLNRQFYQTFGAAFAATRRRIQPGVKRILERLDLEGHWLDLGCGNGELARELARRGFQGSYAGLDFSEGLLREARKGMEGKLVFLFHLADLSTTAWLELFPPASFDVALAFASLHHLPSRDLRLRVLRAARSCLKPGGKFIHSEWQFQHSPKLSGRVQPWERAGFHLEDVDEGDTLLDWRAALPGQAERVGLRYVHLFSLPELAALAADSGFELLETFESDGQGGRLGLYQVWGAS